MSRFRARVLWKAILPFDSAELPAGLVPAARPTGERLASIEAIRPIEKRIAEQRPLLTVIGGPGSISSCVELGA
jgi:hypothetical protein